MMMTIEILGVALAAIGAALALFGKSRSQGKRTRLNKIALALIVAGLLPVAVLELKQWREYQHVQEIDRQWSHVLDQSIAKLGLTFFIRQQIRPATLTARWRDVFIGFDSSAGPRRLVLSEQAKEEDAEKRIRLAVLDSDDRVIGIGERPNLMKRELVPATTEASPQATPEGNTGNVNSKSVLIRGWPYSSSGNFDWTDPNALTCGFEASISWQELNLTDAVRTVRDLGDLPLVAISLPIRFDLKPIDRFDITLTTSDNQQIRFSIASLNFQYVDNNRIVAEVPGHDWLAKMEQDYRKRAETPRSE